MIALEVIEPDPRDQVCRMCGARRGKDEPDDAWVADRHVEYRQHEVRRRARPDGTEYGETREKPWHRRHVACVPDATSVVLAVTGVALPEEAARNVLRKHGRSLVAQDREAAQRAPWGHLTRGERETVVALAKKAAAPIGPVADPRGRCAVCGVGSSSSWSRSPLAWSDRSPAPLCAECREVARGTTDVDLLRVRAVADLAGVRPTPSVTAHRCFGYRFATEVATADEVHVADAGRWEYRATTLGRIRNAVRTALPELIVNPVERAAGVELLQRRRARAATEEARRQAETAIGAGDGDWS